MGIDLGGCMSGTSAYCLIESDGHIFNIVHNLKEPKHKDPASCADFLLKQIEHSDTQKIGIDAPLSIPRVLFDKSFIPKERQGKGEIINPYLFRYCDYFIYQTFGLRPMPPAGDRIGRITARAVELLQKLNIPTINPKIIEVYPKQIAQELGFVSYKKQSKQLLTHFDLHDRNWDEHQIDAFLAAFATMKIDQGFTLVAPKDETEGWCYPLKLR